MAGTGAVRVKGLKELTRAFNGMSKDIAQDLVWELEEAADPVRKEAEQLATTRIRNMPATPHWATMKIGVSKAKGLVYMVPFARRRSGSTGRPNLADLLMTRAMDPALEHNEDAVVKRVDDLLGRLGGEHDFY